MRLDALFNGFADGGLQTALLPGGGTLANDAVAVTSFATPSAEFVQRCRDVGFQIAHESGYLRRRSWLQIAAFGDIAVRSLEGMFARLETCGS